MFQVGLPFNVYSQYAHLQLAPDGAPIYQICCPFRDIQIIRSKNRADDPTIRVSLNGANEKYVRCKPVELHEIKFHATPEFSIFKDQIRAQRGGDFLLKMRAGESRGKFFPSSGHPGGVSVTISNGFSADITTRDTPDIELVSKICKDRKWLE